MGVTASQTASGYSPMDQAILNKAHTDKFIMVFTLPRAMREINVSADRANDHVMQNSMQFSVFGVVAPSVVVDPTEIRFGGYKPYDEYATDITVFGLDEYNEKRIQFTYIGAVPVSLSEISYNYQGSDEVSSQFEFAFSQLHTKLL